MDMDLPAEPVSVVRQRPMTGPSLCMRAEALLELPATLKDFARNEEIYGEGGPAQFVYRVVHGAVRTVRYLKDGRRQIIAFHLPGDVFGYELGTVHRLTAEAIVGCQVQLTRRTTLDRGLSEDLRAARHWLDLTATRLQETQDQLLVLGRMTAAERVSAFLLDMARRMPSPAGIELPMSRVDIADYLGLTIETVSRTLSQLQRGRAISLCGSRRIILRPVVAAAEMAA